MRMTAEEQRRRTQQTIEHALKHEGRHKFGLENIGSPEQPSPKLASAGFYYMDCLRCGRSVFENGSGSATEANCL